MSSRFRASLFACAAALSLCAAAAPAAEPARPWMNRALSADDRAALVVQQLTQDEKLSLVFGWFATDANWKNNFKAPTGSRIGSAGYVPGIARLGIPPQWQTDAGEGVATQGAAPTKRERTALPSGIATAATWNPDIAFKGGRMIGSEARASGFNVMLAGGVNLLRDPRNGRNFEYGGEDPLLAGTIVGSEIAGIQSNHIISTAKHYALNDLETGRKAHDAQIDPAAARMSDLLAFQFAIERGDPGSVMCSYNRVNGTYACENKWLLTDVLRGAFGFRGYVMSDWGATHSTVPSALAGLDQESGWPFDDAPFFGAPLKAAIASGQVPQARLDEMARRILRPMFAHGLVDDPVSASAPIDFAANEAREPGRRGARRGPAQERRQSASAWARRPEHRRYRRPRRQGRARGKRLVFGLSARRQCGARHRADGMARTGDVLSIVPGRRTAPPPAAGEDHIRGRQ